MDGFPPRLVAAAALAVALAGPRPTGAQEPEGSAEIDEAEKAEKAKGKGGHNLSFAAVPGPIYNPSLGFGLMLIPMLMYDIDPEDKVSPGSTSALFGMASTNGSWAAATTQKLYLAKDTWRIKANAGYVSINQRFYGIGGTGTGDHVNMTMEAFFAQAEGLYQIFPRGYAGLQLAYRQARFEGQDAHATSVIQAAGLNTTWDKNFVPGLRFDYDSRDSQTGPRKGLLTEITVKGASEALGSTNSYLRISAIYSQFLSLDSGGHHVLAWNVNADAGFGDVPFDEYPDVGGYKALRGYIRGQHTDKNMLTSQVEWRWGHWHKIGSVVFAGLGKVFPAWDEFGSATWLPSAGFGLRYLVFPARRMNARLDFAWGKEGGSVYFSIGEAF
jgi:outer membrane protein assembly factor BamA